MLRRIEISQYALIEKLEIELDQGLNVITGETGAGKSIIIDAISLLLGQRGNKENIRIGADKMTVQGEFEFTGNDRVSQFLTENGIDAEDHCLIITRSIDNGGKNTCRINGTLVTVGKLKVLGESLIDIHSQHENHALFTAASHRSLLDSQGGAVLAELLQQTAEKAAQLKQLHQEILNAENRSRDLERQKDGLMLAGKEISSAGIRPGEDVLLEQQIRILEKAEMLNGAAETAYRLLNGDDETASGILSEMSLLAEQFKKLNTGDDRFKASENLCVSMTEEFKNMSSELMHFRETLDLSPGALDQAENRLAELTALKRKYGDTLDAVIAYGDEVRNRLDQLTDADGFKQRLKKSYLSLWDDYKQKAEDLHQLRVKIAGILAGDLEKELKDLAMEKAVIQVDIDRDEQRISPMGQDHVEFLVAVNPGTPPRSISKAASGGEISRIMLALKSLFAEADPWITMIFDEIDTGISGRTAQKVAEKILKISRNHQLICITHLPQIAAMADRHFVVEKTSDPETTRVSFNTLNRSQQEEELARMLSGASVTQTARDHAAEMLAMSAGLKQHSF